jgi:tetratricopeptide (TPR) repeat protein
MKRALYALIFSLCFSISLSAQDLDPRLTPILDKFAAFNYEEVIEQASELLSGAAGLTHMDSLELYRLIAISHFSLLNMTDALNAFSMLLYIDPDYHLDVINTPPKIINYFNALKKMHIRSQPEPLTIIKHDTVYLSSPGWNKNIAYSLIFPGLGHLQHDSSSKGWLLISAGTISLAASIYFSIDSADKENAYLKETNPARIEQLYGRYNDAYRLRNISYALFGALWLYAQVDLLFLQEFKLTDNFTINYNPGKKTQLFFSYSF